MNCLVFGFVLTLFMVGRSHKEKRSSYAPEKGVRYDGVYRIEKCWRKVGVQVECAILCIETAHPYCSG